MMEFFSEFPPDARVWVYQSNRSLTPAEREGIRQNSSAFLENWAAHGTPLKASLEVLYDRFIVLCVDDTQTAPSGCAIDESVRFMKQIETDLGISLFDRMQVAYRAEGEVRTCALDQLETLFEKGEVGEETPVFNNLVNTREGLEKEWEVPLRESWHRRFIGKPEESRP